MVGLRYAHPNGDESYCYNTKFAEVEWTTSAGRYRSNLGELEVLTPEPVADIPLHPSPDWTQAQGDYRGLTAVCCPTKIHVHPTASPSHVPARATPLSHRRRVTHVWSGWNHQWGLLSHRVSLVRVRAGDDGSAESGILGGDWSTGESWSDDVNVRIHQQAVQAPDLVVTTGEISFTVGPDGEASAPIPDAVGEFVVLQGFEIDTDVPLADSPDADVPDYDPALGFTSRGFGMAIGEGDESGWEATATVRWGPETART